MTKRLNNLIALVAPLLLLGACSGGGGGGSPANASSVNSALAVAANYQGGVAGVGDFAVFLVNEIEQGSTDLNGDGDTADNVLYSLNSLTGVGVNVGVAGAVGMVSNATHIAFGVPEVAENATDLNGDGDGADIVLAIFDPASPVAPGNPMVMPFAIATGTSLSASGAHVAVAVDEAENNTDLNGDGLLDDIVIQVIDTQAMTTFNTGLPTIDGGFILRGDFLAFTADEASHGVGAMGAPLDLNSDGDTGDNLLYLSDLRVPMNVPVGPGFPRAVLPGNYGVFGTPTSPLIGYAIDEATDGHGSLNLAGLLPDGDTGDLIGAAFQLATLTETIPSGGIAVEGERIRGSTSRLVFSVLEADNGLLGIDLNQDGDTADRVPFWVADTDLANAVNVGLAQDDGSTGLPVVCGQSMVFLAQESDQGVNGSNFNAFFGDADTSDTVFFFQSMLVGAGGPTNLNFAGDEALCAPGTENYVILSVSETANDKDFNLDGDIGDEITYFQRIANSQIVPGTTIIPVFGNISVVNCAQTVRCLAFTKEDSSPALGDMNDDGDFDDYVAVTAQMDIISGNLIGVEVLGSVEDNVGMNVFPIFLSPDLASFPTGEATIGPGVNLNGDQDVSDAVLQISRLSCP